jgi:exodeoxyribonuclease V beta subunit
VLPPREDGSAWKVEDSRELATAACVEAIHALLRGDGAALLDGRAVEPGDIAVLVRRHHEARRVQSALAAIGVPAVTASPQSLFASVEAMELLAVLEALLQPGDGPRLRAALATVLVGLDAAAIDALDADGDALRAWQLRAMDWRERWQRHGPLALVSDLAAEHAPRLLGLLDGERRLTNLLQLGEELQQADARALGSQGLVDWLRRAIAEADPDDEAQQLRLESDARRVRIMTLHKSKGLEFPLVFLPFAGIGAGGDAPEWADAPDDDGPALHLDPDDVANAMHRREDEAEEARLLYVGLTRARHAAWVACGPLYRADRTALAALLRGADARERLAEAGVAFADGALPEAPLPPLPRRR